MIATIKHGCPICRSDVKGDKKNKYFCKKCNILYDEDHIRKGKVVITQSEKVETLKVEREKGYLYFIDKQGDVSRVKRAKSRADKGAKMHEKMKEVGLKKEKGYLYYLDSEGDVSRSPMKRGKNYNPNKEVLVGTEILTEKKV